MNSALIGCSRDDDLNSFGAIRCRLLSSSCAVPKAIAPKNCCASWITLECAEISGAICIQAEVRLKFSTHAPSYAKVLDEVVY